MTRSSAQLEHVAAHICGRPLLIMQQKLDVIAYVLAQRLGLDLEAPELGLEVVARPEPLASRFVGARAKTDDGQGLPFMRTEAGVGIVTVTGSMVNRGAWIGASSGLTSYEGIAAQLRAAAGDSKTKSIVIDENTGGGEATGAFELATLVREINASKPVTAFVNGIAASAGYLIASGAGRIVSIPSGLTGSIGVVMMHADYSRALDRAGITPTFIHSGARKVDGNAYAPLDADTKARLQASVDSMRDDFVAAVGAGRGARFPAKAARDTEAAVFDGKEALALGLVDELATFDALYDDMNRSAGGRRTPASRQDQNRRASMDKDFTKADLDAAMATGRTEGHAAGKAEGHAAGLEEGKKAGATAERARIKAIVGSPEAKGREGLAAHYAYDTEQTAEAAEAALKVSAKAGASSLAERSRDALLQIHTGGTDRTKTDAVVIDSAAIYAERNKVG